MQQNCICQQSHKKICADCQIEFLNDRREGLNKIYAWVLDKKLKAQIIERQMAVFRKLLDSSS